MAAEIKEFPQPERFFPAEHVQQHLDETKQSEYLRSRISSDVFEKMERVAKASNLTVSRMACILVTAWALGQDVHGGPHGMVIAGRFRASKERAA